MRTGNMDDDSELVARVAAELIGQMGEGAARFAQDQAEIATGLEDQLSTEVWLEIADAAAELVRSK
jgi:uncharacterized protein YbjT (DUF2867 family)